MARRWEHELLRRLKAAGHVVSVRHASGPRAPSRGLDRVLALEALRFRSSLASRAAPLSPVRAGTPDLVIDLAGEAAAAPERSAPVLTVDFAGCRSFDDGVAGMFSGDGTPELVARLDGIAVARAPDAQRPAMDVARRQ